MELRSSLTVFGDNFLIAFQLWKVIIHFSESGTIESVELLEDGTYRFTAS